MESSPRPGAIISVSNYSVKLHLSHPVNHPVNADIIREIQSFSLTEDIASQKTHDLFLVGLINPWDTGYKIEQILRKHNVEDLCIKVKTDDTEKQVETLANLDPTKRTQSFIANLFSSLL